MRQALPTHGRIGRQERPAIFHQLLIGIRKAVRRLHAGIVIANTALLVADSVQREPDFLGKLATLFEDRIDKVRRGLFEAWQV